MGPEVILLAPWMAGAGAAVFALVAWRRGYYAAWDTSAQSRGHRFGPDAFRTGGYAILYGSLWVRNSGPRQVLRIELELDAEVIHVRGGLDLWYRRDDVRVITTSTGWTRWPGITVHTIVGDRDVTFCTARRESALAAIARLGWPTADSTPTT